jgi:histidine triad (HIT) family protein
MSDCIFCKIVNKEIPANVIYEDEKVLVFLDIAPINPGHLLVIPKEHYENILDVPEDVLQETILRVKKMALVIDKIADGVNVGQNNKLAAGQIVNHLHFHIIPRGENDGLVSWPGKEYSTKEEVNKLAEELKKVVNEVE